MSYVQGFSPCGWQLTACGYVFDPATIRHDGPESGIATMARTMPCYWISTCAGMQLGIQAQELFKLIDEQYSYHFKPGGQTGQGADANLF